MSVYHKGLKQKKSGGKRHKHRTKEAAHIGRFPTETQITDEKEVKRKIRTKGGNTKTRLKRAKWVNLLDPATGEFEKTEITRFVENPADRHLDRRHILTKGAIIQTQKGKARITSRPGQDGVLNAVLVEEEESD